MEAVTKRKGTITFTVKVIPCEDGGYVGSVVELPVVVQVDNMSELDDYIVMGIKEYAMHNQPKNTPCPVIEVGV